MANYKYGFVGAGRMATALAGGLVEAGLAGGREMIASDPNSDVRQAFAEAVPGAVAGDDNNQVFSSAEIVVLAVKPQVMPDVLSELAVDTDADPLVVSIAAGVPLAKIEKALWPSARVVRVMPNTPCLVGLGASGYSGGRRATAADLTAVDEVLRAVGVAVELPEHSLDAVTGLSGSGPAFVYTMIEALSDGGVAAGLPRDVAHQFAAQTVAGAAQMVLKTDRHPAELREAVTSPGGYDHRRTRSIGRGGHAGGVYRRGEGCRGASAGAWAIVR